MNFKKISAIVGSGLMMGMSLGVAAAANYPVPFVSGGAANVAIIYGEQGLLDLVPTANIQTNLQSYMATATSAGTTTSTSGETVSIDTSADRIWLNTSLNAVKSTFTKSDLPTALADYTFSGSVTSKVTSSIKLIAGGSAGSNSGRVTFEKQPTSSVDPVIGIAMNSSTSGSGGLYNASATMSAVNFTHADSEGEEIKLFGQAFTVSSDTDSTKLVLLKEAQTVDLNSDNPSTSVNIGGIDYTVELVSSSDTTATVRVTNSAGTSESKEINEADSKKINGLDVAVKTADETNLKLSASLIVGADKITITPGSVVTRGENDDPIDGTYGYITGGTTATTEIAIVVTRPDSSNDAILPGQSFVDPVFGSFKIDFAGLSSPLDDSNRGMVTVQNSGDNTMSVKFKNDGGTEKVFDFAHNESGSWFLGDSSNYSISVLEGVNLSYSSAGQKYAIVGNEDYGRLIELYDVYNQTTGSNAITNDRVKFRDVFTGDTYETTFSSTEGSGTVDIDGKRYTVSFGNSGENAGVVLKYPTSDSGAGEYVIYPTIKMNSGSLISLYEPLTVNLTGFGLAGGTTTSKLWFPDGDGYTGVVISYGNGGDSGNSTNAIWTIGGNVVQTGAPYTVNASQVTIGKLLYNITGITTANHTKISLVDPEGGTGGALIDNPGLVIFEGKDDDTNYHAVVVDLETAPAGTSTDGAGVNDVLYSSTKYVSGDTTRASDSDFTEHVDWYGTYMIRDASDSDQKTATLSIPKSQVYAQIFIGTADSGVSSTAGSATAGTQLGNVIVKDSEVSSVSSKNLIVIGGSCINSVAAKLVGGAKCGSDWQSATGVGSGQFLIQSFADAYTTGKIALLVAGYDATDTSNAATYLTTKFPNTASGTKYIGTSATSATLQTTVNSTNSTA